MGIVVGRSDRTRQIDGWISVPIFLKDNPFTSIAPKYFFYFSGGERSEPNWVIYLNTHRYFLLKYKTARPDRYVFQTLISQELLEQNSLNLTTYGYAEMKGGGGGPPPPKKKIIVSYYLLGAH